MSFFFLVEGANLLESQVQDDRQRMLRAQDMADTLAYRGWFSPAVHKVSRMHPMQLVMKKKLRRFLDQKIGEVLNCQETDVRHIIEASYHWHLFKSMLKQCEITDAIKEINDHGDLFKEAFKNLNNLLEKSIVSPLHCIGETDANKAIKAAVDAKTESDGMESRRNKLKKLFAVVQELKHDSFEKAEVVNLNFAKTIDLSKFYDGANPETKRRQKLEVLEFTGAKLSEKESLKGNDLKDTTIFDEHNMKLQDILSHYVKFFLGKNADVFAACS